MDENDVSSKPDYEYALIVVEKTTGETVGKRESGLREVIEQSIGDIPKWIENWEKENTKECHQCSESFLLSALTYINEHHFCEGCKEKIVAGLETPRE